MTDTNIKILPLVLATGGVQMNEDFDQLSLEFTYVDRITPLPLTGISFSSTISSYPGPQYSASTGAGTIVISGASSNILTFNVPLEALAALTKGLYSISLLASDGTYEQDVFHPSSTINIGGPAIWNILEIRGTTLPTTVASQASPIAYAIAAALAAIYPPPIQVNSSISIGRPGVYLAVTPGITITLISPVGLIDPCPGPGNIIIIDATGVPNPNITIAGLLGNATAGTLIFNKGESLEFIWDGVYGNTYYAILRFVNSTQTIAGVGVIQAGAAAIGKPSVGLLTLASGQTALILTNTTTTGRPLYLWNTDAALTAKIFPPVGGSINGGSINAELDIPPLSGGIFQLTSALHWHAVLGNTSGGGGGLPTGLAPVYQLTADQILTVVEEVDIALLNIKPTDGTSGIAALELDSFGNSTSVIVFSSANGTAGDPSALFNGDEITQISHYGFDGTEYFNSPSASEAVTAAVNFDNSHHAVNWWWTTIGTDNDGPEPTPTIRFGVSSGGIFTVSEPLGDESKINPGDINIFGSYAVNGLPVLGSSSVAGSLPSASVNPGMKATVTDSTVVATGNFGAIVAGTGTNIVPVYSDGTNWRIG